MDVPFRIGQGFDVHAFAPGRKLVLGGTNIQFDLGLEGHSDADVLLHAITDAVLGALGWGDIGKWFPDTDERYRGRESSFFVSEVWTKAAAEGWKLGNLDCTLLAQVPKIGPYVPEMAKNIAALFGCEQHQVSIKATTTERLGFVGRKEGIAASAVILVWRG